jgi:hypothetical protein
MTMAAGRWQQPQKQRIHQRRKQRPSGDGDAGSGDRESIGTKINATTGDIDYDAGRALPGCQRRRLVRRRRSC